MSGGAHNIPERTWSAASDWVVRLSDAELAEADWLAFERWLNATPGGRQAYDAALSVWLLADAHGEGKGEGEGDPHAAFAPVVAAQRKGHLKIAAWSMGALASTIAVVLAVIAIRTPGPPTPAPAATLYATAKGERRTVRLADGSLLDLSGASRVAVSLTPAGRRATMIEGEAAFAVTHDPARPFSVAVGDRLVRDLGTEFDIRHVGPDIRVTVRQGQVEVAADDDGSAPVSLSAGQQLRHREGDGQTTVHEVSADEAFAWKQGRLIYRDQPLQVVVNDLNRYFTREVRIEGETTGALHFTGVLAVDQEDATIRRLVGLLPLSATRINGATVLKARETAR